MLNNDPVVFRNVFSEVSNVFPNGNARYEVLDFHLGYILGPLEDIKPDCKARDGCIIDIVGSEEKVLVG